MTLYDDLDVDTSATSDEIKKAYKKKAQASHPDRKSGDADEFNRVKKAYEVLKNPISRMEYDDTGTVADGDPVKRKLEELFNAVIAEGDFSRNLITQCRSKVSLVKTSYTAEINKLTAVRASLAAQLGRIETKDGDNMFEGMIEVRIKNIDRDLANHNAQSQLMLDVMTILNDYTDTYSI